MKDFRTYIQSWASARGRGEYRRMSAAINVHTTLLSQVLNGKKCLTEEQTSKLCGYMSLNALESDYFLKLVQLERAGTEQLREMYKRHLKQIQSQILEIKNRVPESRELSASDSAIFYSSCQYSLIRLMTSIERFQTMEGIASYLDLPISRVHEVLEFLVSRGLCISDRGRLHRTDRNTHIDATSPLVTRHHQNWRTRSLSRLEKMTSEDLAFTAPISLSNADFPEVRAVLLNAISEISKLVEKSPSEKIAYLGIDWLGA
jgi:uncharacterized protein (TIGR02147 family)